MFRALIGRKSSVISSTTLHTVVVAATKRTTVVYLLLVENKIMAQMSYARCQDVVRNDTRSVRAWKSMFVPGASPWVTRIFTMDILLLLCTEPGSCCQLCCSMGQSRRRQHLHTYVPHDSNFGEYARLNILILPYSLHGQGRAPSQERTRDLQHFLDARGSEPACEAHTLSGSSQLNARRTSMCGWRA